MRIIGYYDNDVMIINQLARDMADVTGQLREYRVGKTIGKGSYGEVFLVRHKRERKQVRPRVRCVAHVMGLHGVYSTL